MTDNLDMDNKNVDSTAEANWPHTVIAYDKDGNPVPVVGFTDGTAQDKEYSEDKNGNDK